MAKKDSITLEQLHSLPLRTLADLLYAQMDKDKELYQKVQKQLLKNDPKALIKYIKKDIASIKRGRKFISYYESFEFAKKIANIVEDITIMIEDKKVASALFKELILTDSKVYMRSDDSSGSIQMSYAQAEEGWIDALVALSDDEIYDDIIQLRICEGFGVRSIFDEKIPAIVLEKIYNLFYQKESDDDIYTLKECAHYLKKPQMYIEALKRQGDELHERDLIAIAQEYQYTEDAKGVLDTLNDIPSVDGYHADTFYKLKIWAHEQRNQPLEVTRAYKGWYEKRKSVEVLKAYLERLDGAFKEEVLQKALEDTQTLSFHQAIHFFHSLDEMALAAKYILKNQDDMKTEYMYAKELNKITAWLKEKYPQEAILLHRDSCEKSLKTSQSKHYPSAIKALKNAIMIDEQSQIAVWKIKETKPYMENLFQQHKNKPKFVQLFLQAFGE